MAEEGPSQSTNRIETQRRILDAEFAWFGGLESTSPRDKPMYAPLGEIAAKTTRNFKPSSQPPETEAGYAMYVRPNEDGGWDVGYCGLDETDSF